MARSEHWKPPLNGASLFWKYPLFSECGANHLWKTCPFSEYGANPSMKNIPYFLNIQVTEKSWLGGPLKWTGKEGERKHLNCYLIGKQREVWVKWLNHSKAQLSDCYRSNKLITVTVLWPGAEGPLFTPLEVFCSAIYPPFSLFKANFPPLSR